MADYVIKSTGEKEPFSKEKFQRSLRKAGAAHALIERLTKEVTKHKDLNTTKKIYTYAYSILRKENPPIAARYNLKTAIAQLGPSGFPFEHFVAEIFKAQGYKAKVGQILQGKCVEHEVDVVVEKNDQYFLVECKFHKSRLKSNIKVPLYIKARFDDIVQGHEHKGKTFHKAWVVTNTQFTSVAEQYGSCAGMNMLSWSYPKKDNLARLVDKFALHPITALTSLNGQQKRVLVEQGLVLCRNIPNKLGALKSLKLSNQDIEKIMNESKIICELGAID